MRTAILLAIGLLLGAAGGRPIPEAQMGLAKMGPGDVVAPPPVQENDSAPGKRPIRPRAFPGAPPVIPHGIADYLPITRDRNACVGCHAVRAAAKDAPPPVAASHTVDQRNAPGQRGERVVGASWACTSCHVAQHDVEPLVRSPYPR